MYCTEPPTDKTIREWYMKFQQSGCLCAGKRRGWPGPMFLVFSSTSLRHLFLSFTVPFNLSKPKPVFSFMLSIHLKRGLPVGRPKRR